MARRRRPARPNRRSGGEAGPGLDRRPFCPQKGDSEKAAEYVTKGLDLQHRGKYDKAMEFYDMAIAANPACIDAHCNRGAVLAIKGRHAEALAPLERAAELAAAAVPDEYHAMIHVNLAGVLDRLGRRNEAIGCMDAALDCLNKTDPADHIRELAARSFEMLGENAKAAACWRGSGGPAWRHHEEGMRLASEGRDEEAAACFDRAVREDPSLAEAHYSKGTMMRHLGRFDDALACFRQAANANPDFAMAYSDIAAELNRMGRDDEALESVDDALRKDPDLVVAIFGKGVILAGTKRHREAITWFGRAAKRDPDDALIHTSKGMSHRALGENREALQCFNCALDLDPRNRDARWGRSEAERALGMRSGGSWWDKMHGR